MFPQGSVHILGISVPRKGLELPCGERMQGFARLRPEAEPPFRESLLTEPVPLRVIGEDSQGRAASAHEDEETAAHGIDVEPPANPGKAVYPLSEVDGFDGHQDAHLGDDLDHRKNARASSITLQGPAMVIRSPVGFSIVMVHAMGMWPVTSMKAGVIRSRMRAFRSV